VLCPSPSRVLVHLEVPSQPGLRMCAFAVKWVSRALCIFLDGDARPAAGASTAGRRWWIAGENQLTADGTDGASGGSWRRDALGGGSVCGVAGVFLQVLRDWLGLGAGAGSAPLVCQPARCGANQVEGRAGGFALGGLGWVADRGRQRPRHAYGAWRAWWADPQWRPRSRPSWRWRSFWLAAPNCGAVGALVAQAAWGCSEGESRERCLSSWSGGPGDRWA